MLAQPEWYPRERRWAIHLRITADTVLGGPIPRVTDWFALVGNNYPDDRIGIWPAKVDGIVDVSSPELQRTRQPRSALARGIVMHLD